MAQSRCLLDVLNASFQGVWRDDLAAFLAGRSSEQIVALVDALALRHLGQAVVGATFATKSVGVVFGLELSSGQRAVLKLFDRSQSMASIAATQRCIARLVAAGCPVPAILCEPFQTDEGKVGCFHAFLDGELGDAHEPAVYEVFCRLLKPRPQSRSHPGRPRSAPGVAL